MEVTLEEIVDAIETEDPDALAEILKNGSSNINDYCEVEDAVLMTPLLFAIKMKSPECVDVLLLKGADPNLSIKIWDPEFPEDESKQKSLITNALDYALGEKKNAVSQDVILYDEIIEIIQEAKNKSKDEKKNQKPENTPKPGTMDLSLPVTPPPNIRMGPESLMSPTATADNHRIAQRTVQNQLAIKKLTEENEILKKDLDQLKKEVERFRPWIERWIYQGGPAPTSPSIVEIKSDTEESSKEDQKQKRTRHKSLLLKEAPKEDEPPRSVISPRGTSSKQSRKRANSRKDRDTERTPSKGKSGGGTPQRPKSTALSKNPPGRSVSEKPKTSERHQGEKPSKSINIPPTQIEEDRKTEKKTAREEEKKEDKKIVDEKRDGKRTHRGEERKEERSPQSKSPGHRNLSPAKKRT